MTRHLLALFTLGFICWGPHQCGQYLGRKQLKAGGLITINYYVIRLTDGTVALIEPELIEKGKP